MDTSLSCKSGDIGIIFPWRDLLHSKGLEQDLGDSQVWKGRQLPLSLVCKNRQLVSAFFTYELSLSSTYHKCFISGSHQVTLEAWGRGHLHYYSTDFAVNIKIRSDSKTSVCMKEKN